ncbi:MAG: hypothetical protein Q9220_007174 [cf. Caloplaca sp. 1 TL-2023]
MSLLNQNIQMNPKVPLNLVAPATAHSHKQKRRKREPEIGLNVIPGSASPTAISLPLETYRQYQTAGQPLNEALHPYPFPHAPPSTRFQATSPPLSNGPLPSVDRESESLFERSSQDDPEEDAGPVSPPRAAKPGLRQQHYAVLTSLLHRCLLDRDYIRASRVWAMLLRTEVNGHPLDIRVQDRWGIGAEVLLHLNTDTANQTSADADREAQTGGVHFTQRNLMRAKDYYERLILQYPYRKTSSGSTSSLHFYPVMFGIWIYSIQLDYRNALQKAAENIKTTESAGDSTETTAEESNSESSASHASSGVTARRIAVREAGKVTERLNELLLSPPYSDHSGLWKIQGMLYLWIRHLTNHHTSVNSSETESVDSASSRNSSASETSFTESTAGGRRADREHADAMIKAKKAFSQVQRLGGIVDLQTRELIGLEANDILEPRKE